MNKFQKVAAAAAVTVTAFASAAEARCLTALGGSNPAEVAADVADMTANVHRWRSNRSTWRAPNSDGRLHGVDTDVAYARVSIFSKAAAVRDCERQHTAAVNSQPAGVLVTTGLTCGRAPVVIQNSTMGLQCN